MANDLALIERGLQPYLPKFEDVLRRSGIPAVKIMRTVMFACENAPKLRECSLATLVSGTMTACVLGLLVDGVTGQGFLLPFKGRAQFVPGYKGYPTLGARAGLTINAGVAREGDDFDFLEGSAGFVRHKRVLTGRGERKIIAAWATATAVNRPAIVKVVPYDDVLAIKARAPGGKSADSPWNDHAGMGHEKMTMKTAVRQLGGMIPVAEFQTAAALEGAVETGRAAVIREDGALLVEGTPAWPDRAAPLPGNETLGLADAPPTAFLADGSTREFGTIDQWRAFMLRGIDQLRAHPERLAAFRDRNTAAMETLVRRYPDAVTAVTGAFGAALFRQMAEDAP